MRCDSSKIEGGGREGEHREGESLAEPPQVSTATVRERGCSIIYFAVFLATTCAGGQYVRAEINISDPGTFVIDKANIISDQVERQLEGWLRELEQKTTAQIKLLTVPTTDGEDPFTFALRHAERWKLGRKGKDNGALAVVALKEREFKLLTGYGLEPTLPDSWIGQLTREVIVPNFRAGKYSEGLYNAMVAVANRVADEANVQLTGIPEYRIMRPKNRVQPGGICGLGIFPFIIIILLLTRRRRHHRRWGGGLGEAIFWGSVLNNLGRGGRGGWGGGGFGGGFGGGGGGFGGSFGGGGRFGGGGGGGRW